MSAICVAACGTAAASLPLAGNGDATAAAIQGQGPDPLCEADYARGRFRPAAALRFGIDPELAGSVGTTQNNVKPVNQAKTVAALRALRPPGKELVLRVNRLFESDGEAGIKRFQRIIGDYTRAGLDTELQVRYHPTASQTGNIAAWTRYVRHVVDVFGSNPHLVAMTITNELNVKVSPNTSDGAYPNAEQALVQGIIAAHREAQRHHDRQLKFGFTYAYRFKPSDDVALFNGLRTAGGAFRQALGFVGVDYYPAVIPGPATPIPVATLQMLGVVRRCFMPLGDLGPKVPIWITESGYDTTAGVHTWAQQRAALVQIVVTIRGAARTFGVTDFRWFNLRDNVSKSLALYETNGLMTDTYQRKPSFAAYRTLIAQFGAARSRASAFGVVSVAKSGRPDRVRRCRPASRRPRRAMSRRPRRRDRVPRGGSHPTRQEAGQ
ncbi:MAG: hypothetical protein JOZ98_15215 [Solirubrobacterales bacterium]|nr:hypothetical protein [Solirubrobacterales bacterium]